MARVPLVGLALAWWLSGCSQQVGLRCEDQERYIGSTEIAPIQIPDDLDTPDETDALRVPGPTDSAEGGAIPTYGPCTESPPEFYQEGRPG